jgi:uncharacterized membrane protein (UPF0127 family)
VRTVVALAVAGGLAAAGTILSILFVTPVFRVSGPEPLPVEKEGGLPGYNQTVVSIGGVRLLADIADTPEKQRVGLGVRESMEEGEAMLFLFATESRHPFWMNGMEFPIDIIWLDADKIVVHIERSLQPCPNIVDCPNYTPDEDALYVLETVAGFSERRGVVEGTQAEFDLD